MPFWNRKQKFFDAAAEGDLHKVKECIINGIDTEATTNNGLTALHFASHNGHLEIVKYLVEICHVDKEPKANDGWTPLHCASYNGYLDIVNYLIETCHVDKEAKSNGGWTAFHFASRNGYLEIVKYLILTCNVDTEARSNHGQSALDVAMTNIQGKVVQYLQQIRADAAIYDKIRQIPIQSDPTPKVFLEAAKEGDLDKLKECINNGIDRETKTNRGWTALHCASRYGQLNTVKYLIETGHFGIEAKDNYGQSAYDIAMTNNKCEVSQYLMKVRLTSTSATPPPRDEEPTSKPPTPTVHNYLQAAKDGNLQKVQACINSGIDKEATDNKGPTALYYASGNGHLGIVQYLIETCHVDTEAKSKYEWTALHYASSNGHLEIVKYMIETGQANKEAKTYDGKTALHYASGNGHLDSVEYLVEACKVDAEAKDNNGHTAIDIAMANNKSEVVQFLIKVRSTSASVSPAHRREEEPTSTELTPTEKGFLEAAKEGQVEKVKYCVNNGINKEAKTNDGWTVLYYASYNGHLEIVKYMIESGHVNKGTKNNNGWTALHYASYNGHLEIIKYLIESGHVNKEAKTTDGWTALHYASGNGHLDSVEYLIETCQVDTEQKPNYGSMAFHNAIAVGHLEIVKYLIETCHVDKEAKTNDGSTTLHYASRNGCLDIVKYLIETCHVEKEAKNNDGHTALHIASTVGRLDIVKYLIETCHVDTEATSKDEHTALHIASTVGCLDIVKYLIETCHVEKEAKNNDGHTALHIASTVGRLDIVKYLIETCHVDTEATSNNGRTAFDMATDFTTKTYLFRLRPDTALTIVFFDAVERGDLNCVKECISKRIEKEVIDMRHGWTALHCASRFGHLHIVRYLIEICNVDKEARDRAGWTPLHFACRNCHLDVVKYLIKTGNVEKEAADDEGLTALHRSSRIGHLEVVKFLIEKCKVNKEAKDNDGNTAYDMALKGKKEHVVQYLKEVTALNDNVTGVTVMNEIDAGIGNECFDQVNYVVMSYYPFSSRMKSKPTNLNVYTGFLDTKRTILESDHSATKLQFLNSRDQVLRIMEDWKEGSHELFQSIFDLESWICTVAERRDILDRILVEKHHTEMDEKEQIAILSSPMHGPFYLFMQQKLKCMITSCETLSSGMVAEGGGDMRSFISINGCNELHATKLGSYMGQAIEMAQQNLAPHIPFSKAIAQIAKFVVSFKNERSRFQGLARVAVFATKAHLVQYGASSLEYTIEKLVRLIVRARCSSPLGKFVEENDEFGKFKKIIINLLAEQGNTPAKEQASKAADCAFAHIMKPDEGSILFEVLNDSTREISLAEALAATILGIEVEELRNLATFSTESQSSFERSPSVPAASEVSSNAHVSTRDGHDQHVAQNKVDNFDSAELQSQIRKMQRDIKNMKKKLEESNYTSAGRLKYADEYVESKDAFQFALNALKYLLEQQATTDSRMTSYAERIDGLENVTSRYWELMWQQMSSRKKAQFLRDQEEKRRQYENEKEEQIQTRIVGDDDRIKELKIGSKSVWSRGEDDGADDNNSSV